MRTAWRWIAAAAASAAVLAVAADPPMRAWAERATPPLVLKDLAGREVDLRSLRGHVVLVNFWATWCGPCIAEMPALQRLHERLGGEPFEVLAVNYGESRPKVEGFVRKKGFTFDVLLDPDQAAADAWKARGLPMTYLVDADGRVRYWSFGERDWSSGESLHQVEELLAEASRARR
ncbi:MAG TPA: TlpA disulfide reductase family protein [Usitatibacter sp.]|nr:TlpA disulfide reductase family protein [Usitatibacter sp.]